MKLGDLNWACDRCGAERAIPAKLNHPPVGWAVVEIRGPHGMTGRDLCPACQDAFRLFWYQPAEVSA